MGIYIAMLGPSPRAIQAVSLEMRPCYWNFLKLQVILICTLG